MDYAESRVYQAGDDVRRMDWRLTARSGVAHTKLFQEEREGRLLILLDTNASMRFGTRTRFKSVQAARVAAMAAWYAVRGSDRVGVLAFGAQRQLLRPQGGARGALAVAGAIATWDGLAAWWRRDPFRRASAGGQVDARCVARVVDQRWFRGGRGGTRPDARPRGRRPRSRVLAVADPLELGEPPAGRYPFAHRGTHYDVVLHGDRQRADFARSLGEGTAV